MSSVIRAFLLIPAKPKQWKILREVEEHQQDAEIYGHGKSTREVLFQACRTLPANLDTPQPPSSISVGSHTGESLQCNQVRAGKPYHAGIVGPCHPNRDLCWRFSIQLGCFTPLATCRRVAASGVCLQIHICSAFQATLLPNKELPSSKVDMLVFYISMLSQQLFYNFHLLITIFRSHLVVLYLSIPPTPKSHIHTLHTVMCIAMKKLKNVAKLQDFTPKETTHTTEGTTCREVRTEVMEEARWRKCIQAH